MTSPFVTHSGFEPQLSTEPISTCWCLDRDPIIALSLVFLSQVSQDKEISDLGESKEVKRGFFVFFSKRDSVE